MSALSVIAPLLVPAALRATSAWRPLILQQWQLSTAYLDGMRVAVATAGGLGPATMEGTPKKPASVSTSTQLHSSHHRR